MATSITLDPDSPVLRLYESVTPTWKAAVNHRFVRELFAGTLDDAVLRDYLVQDYEFFDAFVSMLGACVAHADTIGAKLRFAAQLGMLATDEDGYFERSFAELGVTDDEVAEPELSRPAEAFRAEMCAAVDSASYADLLVILVIAEWLYLDWGERDLGTPEREIHRGWIELHRGADFRAWVQFLVDELDRVFLADDGRVQDLIARWYRTVALEFDFFEAGYERAGIPPEPQSLPFLKPNSDS